MNKKKSKFPYLIGFSALLVAFASAFFSVFGLSQLFAGAKIQVIFMAGSLEFAKLVLASFLYRYWIKVNKAMKFYMSVAIFVLMVITSGGIYGYLSSAYQDTATKYEKRGNEITTLNQKKALDSLDMNRLQERYNKLTDLRTTQETRLDTLYNRKQNSTAKRTENLINKTNLEISQLDSLIRIKNDNITEINGEILTLNSENMSGEIGPLKYLSDLTGLPMNKVVNIFILLLIFVFDPLAVTMIIGANVAFKQNEGISDDEHHEEPISKMWSWVKRKSKHNNKENIIVDGGEFKTNEEKVPMIKSAETSVSIEEKIKDESDLVKKENENTLDETLEKESIEFVSTPVDEKKEKEKVSEEYSNDFESLMDEAEKQIIEHKNELEEKIKIQSTEQDGLNIYGESLKETKQEIKNEVEQEIKEKFKEELKQEILQEVKKEEPKKEENFTSIIQNPPPSAYTPGGGIKTS